MAALLVLSLASLLTGTTASCIQARSIDPRGITPRAEGLYTYTALQGPVNWFGLDPQANRLCARGRNQSPIDIIEGTPGVRVLGAGNRPSPNYPNASNARFENVRTAVQVFLTGGSLVYEGAQYNLQQFHFHTPSEHWLRGEHYPVEVHFVHQRKDPLPDGSRPNLVVGFWFQLSKDKGSKLFENVLSQVGQIGTAGATTTIKEIDFSEVSEAIRNRDLYQYSGSLTTPPCSEGVIWLVSKNPLALSVDTHNALKEAVGANARYIQNFPGEQNLLEYEAALLCPA